DGTPSLREGGWSFGREVRVARGGRPVAAGAGRRAEASRSGAPSEESGWSKGRWPLMRRGGWTKAETTRTPAWGLGRVHGSRLVRRRSPDPPLGGVGLVHPGREHSSAALFRTSR